MQLNLEQKKIIESKPNGHSLIKGVAGSGKTTVAVNRIPLLLNHYCIADDDMIIMVTYNKSLAKYVSFIYDKIKDEIDIQGSLFKVQNENKLHIKNIDSLMYHYFSSYKKDEKLKIEVANRKECQNALIDAINYVSNKYSNVRIINPAFLQFIKDEIVWIKACNYTDIHEYQSVDRIGRTRKNNIDGPQKLRKNSEQRSAIFEVLTKYNSNLKKINKIDFQDMALLALKQANKYKKKKYTHILIDESQDLTRVQIEFLKALYNEKSYSSLTFIADVAQSIYPQAWLVKNRSFASIGYDMTGKSNSLSKNYRTTTQIAQAAFSLIKKDEELIEDDNFVKPNLIDKQGDYPIYKNFSNKENECIYIADLILRKLRKNYDFRDIVIISRTTNQLREVGDYLNKYNIPYLLFENAEEFDFAKDCIKLITMHSIKGLEFKVVIMAGMNSKVMPFYNVKNEFEDSEMLESMERKLFYVGMTRATEKLFITSDGRPSKFIKDIDYKYLRIKEGCDIRRIHTVKIEDYLLKESIVDMYSEEEKVRQWILKELNETYKYPLNLIMVEQKISIGSSFKYADISIDIFRNKVKGPYILAEVKRYGNGIDDALNQLKSYMANCPSVQYGIATDGNELVIINGEFEEVDDIPEFNSSMIPSRLENIKYINLKRNTICEFIKDSDIPSEVYINNNGIEEKITNIRAIPIYNEIAAGHPILINDSFEGKYYLPADWIGNSNEIFILKIKGDSMINKNINDGDYVVINKQSAAEIGEIVAVDIEGNATLKTYKTMGGKILLMPENDEYEPIMLDEGQFSIIGIAVGIIKR